MKIRVGISPLLRHYMDIPESVEVNGNTIAECLEELFVRFPESRQWISEKNVMMQILIDHNGRESFLPGTYGLNRALEEGDRLTLVGLITGG